MPQHKYPMQETTNAMIASITYSFLIRKSATINLIIAGSWIFIVLKHFWIKTFYEKCWIVQNKAVVLEGRNTIAALKIRR